VISYLLLRVPKTYAVATRILTEIKYKFENFKPTTFIDFGSGLGSGSLAYFDAF
jgi:ribosomal protein RSM22 (predicted rRNA methylase)